MATTIFNQVGNWRTPEVRLLDPNDSPIDLTGATGVYVWKSPSGTSYEVELNLGRAPANSTDPAAEAIEGWSWATFDGIDEAGEWAEQVQAILPVGSEPLYGAVVTFNVLSNLTPPSP